MVAVIAVFMRYVKEKKSENLFHLYIFVYVYKTQLYTMYVKLGLKCGLIFDVYNIYNTFVGNYFKEILYYDFSYRKKLFSRIWIN